jgi:chemotaxis response regulator CheB
LLVRKHLVVRKSARAVQVQTRRAEAPQNSIAVGPFQASIGSSAGGVEPCIRLVREVPADAGLAIVIVNHLRRGPTMLPDILARVTSMQTHLITAGMSVERNHVYVVPPNCDLTLHDGAFHLNALSKPFGWPNRITIFLNSLAENWKGHEPPLFCRVWTPMALTR